MDPNALEWLERFAPLSGKVRDPAFNHEVVDVAEAVRFAIVDVVNAVAHEQPVALIVEDVQWLDIESWTALRMIGQSVNKSLFMVCTSRVRWSSERWGDVEGLTLLELGELSRTDAVDLFRSELQRRHVEADANTLEWYVDRSGNNPFFITELAAAWAADRASFVFPPTLVTLISSRVNGLGSCALHLIQAAAILGTQSCIETIGSMLEYPNHVLLHGNSGTGRRGLGIVRPETRNRPASGVDMISSAKWCWDACRSVQEQSLHVVAAQALEKQLALTGSMPSLFASAYHWLAAGDATSSFHQQSAA